VKLIFLNRYFHPDLSATSQMLSDLAFGLAAQGHRVSIITSRQRYDDATASLPAREDVSGVDVHRVWTSRFGRRNLAGRAVDYGTFYISAALTLWRLARAGDIVVAKTDPPMLGVISAPVAHARGAYAVNWLQDVFPEVAQALGTGGRAFGRVLSLLARIRNRSLRRAEMNVVIGERMATLLKNLGVPQDRIAIIANWTDCQSVVPVARAQNPLRASWGLSEDFVVGYSGNLGRAHEIDTFLDAIARTERDAAQTAKPIRWLFIGGGAMFEEMRKEAQARELTTLQFEPYQPRERLSQSLSAADVHLVSLRPELEGLIVPSKFYGIAAVGRPAIFIGDPGGEVARLIARFGCGLTVAQDRGEELAAAVMSLAADPARCDTMGRNGRTAAIAEFDVRSARQRWEEIIARMTGTAHRVPAPGGGDQIEQQ